MPILKGDDYIISDGKGRCGPQILHHVIGISYKFHFTSSATCSKQVHDHRISYKLYATAMPSLFGMPLPKIKNAIYSHVDPRI